MVRLEFRENGVELVGRWASVRLLGPAAEELLRGLREALELMGRFSGLPRLMAWRAEIDDGLKPIILTVYSLPLRYIVVKVHKDDEEVEFLIPDDVAEEWLARARQATA